jgi:hypothetical protein
MRYRMNLKLKLEEKINHKAHKAGEEFTKKITKYFTFASDS